MQSRAAVRGVRRSESRRGASHRMVRAAVESLETRCLMSVSTVIPAMTVDTGFTTSFTTYPADPSGAVGPDHLVDTINGQVQWFTRAGVNQQTEALTTFFAPLGTSASSTVINAKVIYDQYAQRFVVAAVLRDGADITDPVTGQPGTQNISQVLLAVSSTTDPNQPWYYESVNTKLTISSVSTALDDLGVGVSQDAIYLTGNMFSFATLGSISNSLLGNLNFNTTTSTVTTSVPTNDPNISGAFAGTRLWILPKLPLFTGGTSSISAALDPVTSLGLASTTFTLQPAHMYGDTPSGVGTFLVATAPSLTNGDDQLYIIRVDNPLGGVTFSSQTMDVTNINSDNFNGAPQPQNFVVLSPGDTALKVDVQDSRVQSVVWRNGQLYAANEVTPPTTDTAYPTLAVPDPDADQITAHFYQFSTGGTTSLTSTYSLVQQGNVGGEDIGVGVNTFYPSITVNADNDIAIGFSASGPGAITNNQSTTTPTPVYIGAYVTTHLTSEGDLPGTLRPSQIIQVAGDTGALFEPSFSFFGFGTTLSTSAFGRYSSIQVDPKNDTDFWAFNIYALAGANPALDDPTTTEYRAVYGYFNPTLVDLPAYGNLVFADTNGNGLYEPQLGEKGIGGVIIRLFDSNGNLIDQTTSAANGFYFIQGTPSGHAVPGLMYRLEADISAISPDSDPTSTTVTHLLEGYTFSPAKVGVGAYSANDSDFTPISNPFTGQPNLFTAWTSLIDSNVDDLDETFDLGIFKPFASITADTPTVLEGDPGAQNAIATFRVSLSTGILPTGGTQPVSSPWTTTLYYNTVSQGATPDVDYVSANSELISIAPGETSTTFNVGVIPDLLPEGDEQFGATLIEPSTFYAVTATPGVTPDLPQVVDTSQIQTATAFVTIHDNDQPVVTVDPGPTVQEPGTDFKYALFTVRLSTPSTYTSADPVTVHYSFLDGSATGGVDYDNTPGTVVFGPGQLTQVVRVKIYGDFVQENTETFQLVLSDPNHAYLATYYNPGQSTSTGTILNLGSTVISFGSGKSASYKDLAGNTVTITITGPGSGQVTRADNGQGRELVLNGTTEKTTVTIRTSGRGQTTFSGITIFGGLALLNAPGANLAGNLVSTTAIRTLNLNAAMGGTLSIGASTGLGVFINVNIGRLIDASISSGTSIRLFTTNAWIDSKSPADFLSAPAITTLRSKGDFDADILSGSLTTLTVNGALSGSTVSISRTLNDNTSGAIGSITAGSIINSVITTAGSSSTTVKGSIGSILTRKLFSDSRIETRYITRLALATVRRTLTPSLQAVIADKINSVTWTFGRKTQHITSVDAPGIRGLDNDENPTIYLLLV